MTLSSVRATLAASIFSVLPIPVMRRILILFAHPSIDRSEVNVALYRAADGTDGVTLVDLYAEYPDLQIDIDREQQRLRDHDVIIFLHPLYWYSTPAIMKEWQDLVLEHGFAYGTEGTELHGKLFFNAISAGGIVDAYRADGYNHFTIQELMRPLEQMAALCGMIYLPAFALFGARTASEENRIESHIEQWCSLLAALRDERLDITEALKRPLLNSDLNSLLQEV